MQLCSIHILKKPGAKETSGKKLESIGLCWLWKWWPWMGIRVSLLQLNWTFFCWLWIDFTSASILSVQMCIIYVQAQRKSVYSTYAWQSTGFQIVNLNHNILIGNWVFLTLLIASPKSGSKEDVECSNA